MIFKIYNLVKPYLIVGIVLLAFILRFNQLSNNPPGLTWDEASIGYNAYSILKTGADEYGNPFPISFRSFDDFKPPIYIYFTVPSVAVFGLNEFAVRFPSALFGTASVLFFYLLVKEVLRSFDGSKRETIASLSAFFLAVSPWHLQFSRAGYEGNLGLFFLICATYFFLLGLRKNNWLVFSSILFLLGIYSYHSFRLVIPIFLLALLVIFWKDLIRKKVAVIFSAMFFLSFSLPVYSSLIIPNDTQARLSMVSVFVESDDLRNNLQQLQISREQGNIIGEFFYNRRAFFFREVMVGYLNHFSPNFLLTKGAGSLHHHAVNFGMMYLWDALFLLAGLYFLIKKINRRIIMMIAMLLLAPIPSAIATGSPHGVRAISMIPTLILLLSVGFYFVMTSIYSLRKKIVSSVIVLVILLLFIINFLVYLNLYYVDTPRINGYFWNSGNKEAISEIEKIEKDYEKIVMTYKYDQPYIYYLFYNKIDPVWYQNYWMREGNKHSERFKKVIGKYEFRNINYSVDKDLPNTLLVGTSEEIEDTGALKEINFPDGRTAYKLISTK